MIGEKKGDEKKRRGKRNKNTVRGGEYILATRYKIQSEMKRLFEYSTVAELQADQNRNKSFLFPNVPPALIPKLRNQYNVDKGKDKKNHWILEKEKRED